VSGAGTKTCACAESALADVSSGSQTAMLHCRSKRFVISPSIDWSPGFEFRESGLQRARRCAGRDGRPKRKGENKMKDSTKDQVQGKLHEAKGSVKEKAGKLFNNSNLEAEGQDEKVAGKIQKKVGQIETVVEK
jgi:uncharacterized protein YjbJ (UPF0337 family)